MVFVDKDTALDSEPVERVFDLERWLTDKNFTVEQLIWIAPLYLKEVSSYHFFQGLLL